MSDHATEVISAADTGFMMVCSALVLLMTPGLAFFYGGLVRRKNVLSVLMQCFVCMCLVTVIWVFVGFSLSFGTSIGSGCFGNPGTYLMLNGVTATDPWPATKIPMLLFMMFQCMFAMITPALILGAYAERIRFLGFCVFTALWLLLCYCPLCHWAWGGGLFHGSSGGFLMREGEDAIDFAGGTVVHINAGIAALVSSLCLGRRSDYEARETWRPHNLPFVVLGAGLLWFGWFGFNAGSELAADGKAVTAFVNTHVATAAAGIVWSTIDMLRTRRATVLGMISGCVAGLVAITPGCADVDIAGALCLGAGGSAVSYPMVAVFKERLGYDDTLDVFGIHGTSGIWGSVMVGLLTVQLDADGNQRHGMHQVWVQLKSVLATLVYTGFMSFLLVKVVDKTVGMGVDAEKQRKGLDQSYHAETAYHDGEEDENAIAMSALSSPDKPYCGRRSAEQEAREFQPADAEVEADAGRDVAAAPEKAAGEKVAAEATQVRWTWGRVFGASRGAVERERAGPQREQAAPQDAVGV